MPAAGSACTIDRVERTLSIIEGRWKLLIVHHLFVRQPLRFSELERAIPNVTQKMLIQQLRALEADGIVERIAFPVVPPHVEYSLTTAGRALEPALNALHDWAAADHLTALDAGDKAAGPHAGLPLPGGS